MGASMSSRPRSLVGLTFVLLLFSGSAQALIAELELVPDPLFENRPVGVQIEFVGCSAPVPNVDGRSTEIRRDGDIIDFYYAINFVICSPPPPGPIINFDLGYLPQGVYTLRVVYVDRSESFPPNMDGLDPIIVPFSVGGPVFEPIPTLRPWALAALVLLLGGLAVYRLRG